MRQRDVSIHRALEANGGAPVQPARPVRGVPAVIGFGGVPWLAPHVPAAQPPTCVMPWRPLVVLCPRHGSGWKVVGKLEARTGDGEPAHTLAEGERLGDLCEELRLRGYTLREGWLDEARHTGLAIYERRGSPAAARAQTPRTHTPKEG